MTNDSAIPDFNSDNGVSQTDSQQSHEESAAIEDDLSNQNDVEENFVHFISSTSNFNRNLEETAVISNEKLDSEQTETLENFAVEETTVIFDEKLDSEQTETLENSAVEETTVISDRELDSEQTETTENSAVEETTVISDQKLDSEQIETVEKTNPVEQSINDRISTDIPLLENAIAASQKIQVEIRSEKDRLVLTLPTVTEASVSEYSWSEIWQQMKLRLLAQKRFFSSKISVHLITHDRLLDSRQLQDIADTLSELSLQLKSVGTSRRQTAIADCGCWLFCRTIAAKSGFFV